MSTPQSNSRGIAYVNDRADFETFVMDFYIFDDGVFDDIKDWYKFFCEGFLGSATPDFDSDFDPDIMQLIDELDDSLIPEEFPAIVVFNFEDFVAKYMVRDEAIFEVYPIRNLDIRSIETKEDSYTIARYVEN